MHSPRLLYAWILMTALASLACSAAPEPGDERYANGKTKTRGRWVQGDDGRRQRTGHWVFWYPTGQKKAEGDYVNGREDGGEDGLGIPVDGQRGTWAGWYENGQKAFAYRLDDAGRHAGLAQRWHANGQLASEATPIDRNGRCLVIQWRASGSKWIESMQDADGELDGDLVEWDGDGKILKQQTWQHGKRVCLGQACP